MPGILDFLKTTGHGALTGASMLAAVRQGKDPFALFTERDIRQQQLADLEQAAILKKAAALQDPASRAFLQQNPQAAGAFGLPTDTVVGAGANFPVAPDQGAQQPQDPTSFARQLGILPPEVLTNAGLQRQKLQGDIDWQSTVRNLVSGGGGGQQPQIGGMGGGVTPVGGGAIDRPPMRLTGFTGTSPTFGVTPEKDIQAGTINPATGKPFQSGDKTPSGATALVPPSKGAAANKARLSQIDSALNGFNAIYNTRLDPTTGQPIPIDPTTGQQGLDPTTGQPAGVYPHTVLPSATGYLGTAGFLSEALPKAASLTTRLRGQYGSDFTRAAVQRLKTGEGTVVTFVKAMGDAANAAIPEQDRALKAFLPMTGDTEPTAELKRQLTPKVLMAVREKLAGMEAQLDQLDPKDADALAWTVIAQAANSLEQQVAGAGTVQSPSASPAFPSPAPTEMGMQGGGTGFDAINEKREALGLPPIQARAKGGSAKKGNLTLVGENGPELARSASPMTIQPLQMAQNTPWSPQPTQAPMQLQAPVAQAPRQGGLTMGGQGLTDEDIMRARQGGVVIIMGPNGPVAVPR